MKKHISMATIVAMLALSCEHASEPIPPPPAPRLRTPVNGAVNQSITPTVVWDASAGATHYQLQVSTSPEFTALAFERDSIVLMRQTIITLSNSAEYFWRIRAVNGGGYSPWSEGWSFRTVRKAYPVPALTMPENNAVNQSASVILGWNAIDSATSYGVQVSLMTTFSSLILDALELTTTNQPVSGLSDNTVYFWRVRTNFHGDSSEWSKPFTFMTGGFTCETSSIRYAGGSYPTVQIGDRCWFARNLNVGTLIRENQTSLDNDTIEKYCYGDAAYLCGVYGALYDWDEAMQYSRNGPSHDICPPGWHIPGVGEFISLLDAVGRDANALKAVGQGTGDGAGTNASGFLALLGGTWTWLFGYEGIHEYTSFWSSSISPGDKRSALDLDAATAVPHVPTFGAWSFSRGSIRCIRRP